MCSKVCDVIVFSSAQTFMAIAFKCHGTVAKEAECKDYEFEHEKRMHGTTRVLRYIDEMKERPRCV